MAMKRDEFTSLMNDLFDDCRELNRKKGKDYAGDEDALLNFKEAAIGGGITPLQVWYIFADKHYRAVTSYVRNGKVESEPIEERIKDLIVYLTLLQGLVIDAKETKHKKRKG